MTQDTGTPSTACDPDFPHCGSAVLIVAVFPTKAAVAWPAYTSICGYITTQEVKIEPLLFKVGWWVFFSFFQISHSYYNYRSILYSVCPFVALSKAKFAENSHFAGFV